VTTPGSRRGRHARRLGLAEEIFMMGEIK